MTNKVYYSPDMNNNYTAILTTTPSTKDDWNKVSSLEFESKQDLKIGGHIVYVSTGRDKFGGQILSKEKSYNNLNKYTVLDYRKYLLTRVNFKPTGFRRSSDIVKRLLKKYAVYASSPIKLNIKNTPKKSGFVKVEWEDKTLLEIINELIYLEFINGTLIYCNIDYLGKLTYKPVPQTVTIPVLTRCFDGSYKVDYTNIQTSLVIDGKVVKENKELTSIFGNMNSLLNTSEKAISYTPEYNSNTSITGDDIDKYAEKVAKWCSQFKYSNDGSTTYSQITSKGKGTDKAMADLIFLKLKHNGIKSRVMQYSVSWTSTHQTVQYYYKKWKNVPMNTSSYGNDKHFYYTSKASQGKIVKSYNGG